MIGRHFFKDNNMIWSKAPTILIPRFKSDLNIIGRHEKVYLSKALQKYERAENGYFEISESLKMFKIYRTFTGRYFSCYC